MSPKMPRISARELQGWSWYEDRRRGSHRVFKHPSLPGRVVVSDHGSATLKPGTLAGTLSQAGKTTADLIEALERR